jgi:signal transduction histidine kinase
MRLSAAAERAEDAGTADVLSEAAASARTSVRFLRSTILDVYPPNLQQAGLSAAISDLTARLRHDGLEVRLEVDPPAGFHLEADALLFRACQEALRNVEAHACAKRVDVVVRREQRWAVLEVADDGRGIAAGDIERARGDGHVGLRILEELVRDAGGSLVMRSRAGGGTLMRAEVPA